MKCVLIAFGWLLASMLFAAPIPSDRITDWTQVGIPGGIPTTYTQFCNVKVSIPGTNIVAVGDGVTDDTGALQAALTRATDLSVVYLPAGTYLTTAALTITGTSGARRQIIRGEGPSLTLILNNATSGDGIIIFQPTWAAVAGSNIVSGATEGSTQIVLGSAVLGVGSSYFIGSNTDPPDIIRDGCSTDGDYFHRFRQIVTITNVSGTTAQFNSPLRWDLSAQTPWVHIASNNAYPTDCGIENLAITFAQAGTPIRSLVAFGKVSRCWVTGCVLSNTVNNAVNLTYASRCHVVSNVIHHSIGDYVGGRAYGIWEFDCASDNLIQDNIFFNMRHAYASEGFVTGSVIAYNYETNEFFRTAAGTPIDAMSGSYITHGAGAKYLLFEGNIGDSFAMDNVHASGLRNTIFRNRSIPVTHNDDFPDGSITYGTIAVIVNHHNNYINVVGNVLGIDGVSANYEGNTTNAPPGYAQYIYMLGFPCGNTGSGTNGISDTVATLLRVANFDYVTDSTLSDAGSDTNLPTSYYLAGKPTWFGTLPWPSIGSDLSPMFTQNPAMMRYYGQDYFSLPPFYAIRGKAVIRGNAVLR